MPPLLRWVYLIKSSLYFEKKDFFKIRNSVLLIISHRTCTLRIAPFSINSKNCICASLIHVIYCSKNLKTTGNNINNNNNNNNGGGGFRWKKLCLLPWHWTCKSPCKQRFKNYVASFQQSLIFILRHIAKVLCYS